VGLVLLPVALIAYFNGIFLAFTATARRSEAAQRGAEASFVLAWVLQIGAIAYEGVRVGYFPLTSGGDYLLVLSWIVLSLDLFVTLRWRITQASLILPPLAALMAFVALLIPARGVTIPRAQQTWWFGFHVGISVLGMGALCLAFAMALIYLMQDRALKAKRAPKVMERLPSLAACDRIGYHAVLWGFPLLTIGIATGQVVLWAKHGTLWMGGAKQVFPILAWTVLAVLLYARLVRGFRGRKSAYLTIAGFALGLLTVLGMTR
jgi:ABC-type uncharacterized transport system permease subunit